MHRADNAGPSMAPLCKVPSGGKEGTISGACFLLGRHHYWGASVPLPHIWGSVGPRPDC